MHARSGLDSQRGVLVRAQSMILKAEQTAMLSQKVSAEASSYLTTYVCHHHDVFLYSTRQPSSCHFCIYGVS